MPFPRAVTYVPGRATGLVADGVALLLDADAGGDLVASCRDALAELGVDGVLDALSGSEPSPGFALAATEGDQLRLVVAVHGQVEFAGGVAATISAAGLSGWLDQSLDGAPDLRLSLLDPANPIDPTLPVLPIGNGTVLAVALHVPAVAAARPVEPGHPVDPEAITGQVPAEPQPAPSPTAIVPLPPAYVAAGPPAGGAPMVDAVMCASGHLNAPFVVGACRVCGAPVPAQTPFLAPRPTMGVLVLDSGETVPVDRDVLLGRAPFSVEDGPRLVTLPSPNNHLSRTHVRVTIEGWLVQVVDLGSTNGTVATMPGQHGVRLRSHEPFVLVPGTLLNLADEALVRFEVPA